MGRAMVWLLAAAWSVAVVLPAAADRATQIHTIEVGGLTRTYLLHVPPSLPAGPVPLVLVFHGRGRDHIRTGRITDAEGAPRRWARLDGPAPEPRSTVLPAPGKDHCGGLRLTYSGGRDGSEVVLVRLDGGGHTWPGGTQYLPEGLIGRVCRAFSATSIIWEFFRAHPKP